jgi:hypothetical protein
MKKNTPQVWEAMALPLQGTMFLLRIWHQNILKVSIHHFLLILFIPESSD